MLLGAGDALDEEHGEAADDEENEREADLAEALAFARLHLAAPLAVPVDGVRP